ncbi:hypothetical protein TRSC58_07364 [Trypanosoma rangeli SC58]|uniref:Uncharacterized protein n=1 Tax=Trypanosoma rangeli SC58 TaxID=429131 RepID=A0A061IRN1_TRYRA|nr:hypothetical protein TRSC58_07364 [Trypanosoma rangeli SC58]
MVVEYCLSQHGLAWEFLLTIATSHLSLSLPFSFFFCLSSVTLASSLLRLFGLSFCALELHEAKRGEVVCHLLFVSKEECS